MRDTIQSLDDATALRVASTFAQAQLCHTGLKTHGDANLLQALQEGLLPELGVTPSDTADSSTDGDLARAALLVLSEQPEHRGTIWTLINGPQAKAFMGVEFLAAGVIGLVVLQTYVKIERDKSGRWTFKLEKKPTQNELLAKLITSLIPKLGK